jgi:SAM-dependent methyltransferase
VNANRELWEKGDFGRIAASMRGSGEALVDGLGVEAGMDVLDLGCGEGTTALPAAERGAKVLGVDIAANLVATGQARAAAAGLDNVSFHQGDASQLVDLDDDRFDLTLSAFGAMFAPRPYDVAKEMVRVTRPGGRIAMANWIPGDPTLVAQILKIAAAYSPPPPQGFISPMTWGVEDEVVDRFGEAGIGAAGIGFERGTWIFDYDGTPEELVGLFRDYYGPTMNAFAAAAADGREGLLQAELDALFADQNRARDGGTEIAATFLLVNVTRSYP